MDYFDINRKSGCMQCVYFCSYESLDVGRLNSAPFNVYESKRFRLIGLLLLLLVQ